MAKVIGIVGSRRRNSIEDYHSLLEVFDPVFEVWDTLVSGGCPEGGDRFAEEIARAYGLPLTIHYPNWNKFGKRAGFVRNSKIAKDCDVLIAVVAPDRKGGTEDTIKKVIKLGKKVYYA